LNFPGLNALKACIEFKLRQLGAFFLATLVQRGSWAKGVPTLSRRFQHLAR
jgi:hypothetical protein